jgi:gamma-glutamyltranspeptidase/glutathione hydrolase
VVIGNPNNGEFRFVGAGGGGPGAAYATGAVARAAMGGQRVGTILAARHGQGGYVNALACPQGIRSYGASCSTGIDNAGPGLALVAVGN